MLLMQYLLGLILIGSIISFAVGFLSPLIRTLTYSNTEPRIYRSVTQLDLFPWENKATNTVSNEYGAQKAIASVVNALRKDKETQKELGTLIKVTNVLGFGSPTPDKVAVRFNASFQRNGKGMSAKPMPFGLGQTNQIEGRGIMVGQVKASVDAKNGRVLECTVFRDLGYGRSFNLKLPQ